MHFTLPSICIVAPLLSLILSVTSSAIPSVSSFTSLVPSVTSSAVPPTSPFPSSTTLVGHPVPLDSDISIPEPTPLSPKTGAPDDLVLDAKQEWAVSRMLDGTSKETIIGLEPWYWPKAGCCKLHWTMVIECHEDHKRYQNPSLEECARMRRVWESCRMNLGYSLDDQKWQLCYYIPPSDGGTPPLLTGKPHPPNGAIGNDSRVLGPEDVAALHCLTNQFFVHKARCVALADPGTKCPISAGGGERWIQTGDMTWPTRISAECSRTMQAAEDSLLGIAVSVNRVVVLATHQNWVFSEELIFWGPGNWWARCDRTRDRGLRPDAAMGGNSTLGGEEEEEGPPLEGSDAYGP